MQYRLLSHTSRPLCAAFVKSLYLLKNDGAPSIYGCVPNGELGISLIINGSAKTREEASWTKNPHASVYGMIQAVQFHKMEHGYEEFNIGFKPYIFSCFLPHSMASIEKRKNNRLDDLFTKEEKERLYDEVSNARTDDALLDATESFLARNLRFDAPDPRLLFATKRLDQDLGLRIEDLSKELNLSSATLRNLFREHVGLSPKEYTRILRIKKALQTGNQNEESLAAMAFDLGYYDQAHFNHDFKLAIGLSPGNYFKRQELVFDFYKYERWSYASFGLDLIPTHAPNQ